MTKAALRKIYKEKRRHLTSVEKQRLDALLLLQLQQLQLPFIAAFMNYWPMEENNEPDTHLFTNYLEFVNPGAVTTYPISHFDTGTMQAAVAVFDTAFRPNGYGIFEPVNTAFFNAAELDIVFVPLLAFDKKGYRVGYGKGFYDRFLVNCKETCLKIGFSYFEAIDEITDTNQFDVPLSYCITPEKIYAF
jgi:5-formyltetrahydrofolate cyclo-ligase